MELSGEDLLRLNVLLANQPRAVRLDEAAMTLHALCAQGEMRVELRPNCRNDLYLRRVRELLSGHVLGSPGGYPVYLRRWTRMGQMRDQSLEQLLLLGEPEAVVAVVCAAGLTDELARRAWWVLEDAENARRMLQNPAVRDGAMGPVLARYLYDYLPFETEPEVQAETVRLILQPALLEDAQRLDLWRRAARKAPIMLGFLAADPAALPEPPPASPRLAVLSAMPPAGAETAPMLQTSCRALAGPGQQFCRGVLKVLDKAPSQDIVLHLFQVLADYFQDFRPHGVTDCHAEDLAADAQAFVSQGAGLALARQLAVTGDDWTALLRAQRFLSGLNYGVLRAILRDSTASGSLLRRKLQPVTSRINEHLNVLLASG